MKKIISIYGIVLLTATVAFAWLGGIGTDYQLVIHGIGGSQQTTTNNAPPFGENFDDGFTNGYPLTFQIYVVPNDPTFSLASNYVRVALEYFQGTNTLSSTNWTEFAAITSDFNVYTGAVRTLTFAEWVPPATNQWYLIRLYGEQIAPGSGSNLDRTEANVDSEGGVTHDDEEVVLIYVTDNKRPGTE